MYLKKLKIGNVELENNLILAPMAGVTDLPFRRIVEKFNPGLVCTEMVSSKALLYGDEKTKGLLNTDGEKRPISMQIFGNDIESMKYAAQYVSKLADILDVTPTTMSFKLSGRSSLSLRECVEIKRKAFPDKTLDYLFATEPD